MNNDNEAFYGDMALEALYDDDIATFITFMEKNPALINHSTSGCTLLHHAVREGALPFAEYLVKKGVNMDALDDYLNRTPLGDAVAHGYVDIVRLLLAHGAQIDLNAPGSPMLLSIAAGEVEIVKLLLNAGLDMNKVYEDSMGKCNALSYAVQLGRDQIADLLRALGCHMPTPEELEAFARSSVSNESQNLEFRDDNHRTEAIFELMRRVENGDANAEKKLRQLSDSYFEFPGTRNYLLTTECEVEHVRKCIAPPGWIFFIPDSFSLEHVEFDDGTYTLFGRDGRTQKATHKQLRRIVNNLPWGGQRVTAKHVERAFLTCHLEDDVSEFNCPPLGNFKFEYDTFTLDEYRWQDQIVFLSVCARTKAEFEQCLGSLLATLDRLSEFDAVARSEFARVLRFNNEELHQLAMNDLLFYIDGEFDIRYPQPEDSEIEYVEACFSKDKKLLDVTFGNY